MKNDNFLSVSETENIKDIVFKNANELSEIYLINSIEEVKEKIKLVVQETKKYCNTNIILLHPYDNQSGGIMIPYSTFSEKSSLIINFIGNGDIVVVEEKFTFGICFEKLENQQFLMTEYGKLRMA